MKLSDLPIQPMRIYPRIWLAILVVLIILAFSPATRRRDPDPEVKKVEFNIGWKARVVPVDPYGLGLTGRIIYDDGERIYACNDSTGVMWRLK